MGGVYIHVPFCRKKCFYCDFYKTTAVSQKPLFLQALHREIDLQCGYLGNEPVETVYFGGGTPSVLLPSEIADILAHIRRYHTFDNHVEVTVEANPDDLSSTYLKELKKVGVNRLSIGIQSFHAEDLKQMNRRHTRDQAVHSVYDAREAGFNDISIDLIYGLPGLSMARWEENLRQAMDLPATHLSAYHLTYHEGTMFFHWLKKGQLKEIPEDESIAQFEMLIDISAEAGYEHYEISNFARNQAYSKHNSAYWKGKKYLGLGPSAHSYDLISRQWNIADLYHYLKSLDQGVLNFEKEILSPKDRLNDFLITRIRTKWGLDLNELQSVFSQKARNKLEISAEKYLKSGLLQKTGDIISLSRKGIMVSDEIMLALLSEEDQ
ncbi:putative oxygen-independent coproporphyrinogen III oxidase [Bacteroidales bacterium 6E]|nr:putative oxygen-independent coproporphyrinogen III oxidase [Bacteroidales bacterium 6E]